MNLIAALALALAGIDIPGQSENRAWTDDSGLFKIEARLIKNEGGKVTLKRSDNGMEITVPFEQFSEKDKEYLNELAKLKEQMEAAKPVVQPGTVVAVGEGFPPLEVQKFAAVKANPFGNAPEVPAAWANGQPYLIFLTATWCPPCLQMMPFIEEIHNEFGAKVKVIALSVESEGPAADKVSKSIKSGAWGKAVNYDVLATTDQDIIKLGKVVMEGDFKGKHVIPYVFVINGKGKVEWTGIASKKPTDKKASDLEFYSAIKNLAK